jgi:hypothetical protein
MVGVTVSERHEAGRPALKLTQDPPPGPASRSINQNVPKQMDVEEMGGKAGKLPDTFCDFLHLSR